MSDEITVPYASLVQALRDREQLRADLAAARARVERLREKLQQAIDTFKDTKDVLRMIGHPVAAQAMEVAENETRRALEEDDVSSELAKLRR